MMFHDVVVVVVAAVLAHYLFERQRVVFWLFGLYSTYRKYNPKHKFGLYLQNSILHQRVYFYSRKRRYYKQEPHSRSLLYQAYRKIQLRLYFSINVIVSCKNTTLRATMYRAQENYTNALSSVALSTFSTRKSFCSEVHYVKKEK